VVEVIPPIPSFDAGFGRLTLENVMKFDDSEFNLFTVSDRTLDTEDLHHYCFRVSLKERQFKATLGKPASIKIRLIRQRGMERWSAQCCVCCVVLCVLCVLCCVVCVDCFDVFCFDVF